MTGRRSPALAVALCAVGGLLVLLTSGRQWAHTTVNGTELTATGHQVAASLPATGFALVALAAAILASNGLLRRLVGMVVVLIGAAAVGVAITARGDVSTALRGREVGKIGLAVHASANGWWLVSLLGGLLALAAGLLTVARSASWSAMGAKYDAPAAPKPAKDPATVAWDALDRGEDPTA